MKKSILVLTLSSAIIMSSTTINAFGADLSAGNFHELENILLEQMARYNRDFKIKYTGSLDNIENVLKGSVSKDPYINSNVKSMSWGITGTTKVSNIDIDVDYIITESKRAEADKQIEKVLSEIIKPQMNDHEKVKAVHDFIVLHGKYDTSMQLYSDYDLLIQRSSVCNGYALLTYNMLHKLNIPVKLVTGTGNGELHIWNMVKLGDHWFHLDVTWNDPVPDSNTVSYTYYMLTDKEILKDHTIDESLELPKASKRYYDYLKELSCDNMLMETGLDIYDDVNTAETESELMKLLEYRIKHHQLKISVRINKKLTQEVINSAMSNLFKYDYISEISYGQLNTDSTGEYNILNLFVKYKETPDRIAVELTDKVYNTATKVNFSVYAFYGNKKVNITDNVLMYPNSRKGIDISSGSLIFKKSGIYNLKFEYQGIQTSTSVTAFDSEAFKYITDKKPNKPVNVMVYNKYIDFNLTEQWPFIENGRTMVPLRAVFEAIGCNVSWDNVKSSAVVEYDGTKIVIPASSSTAYINGTASTLDVPAMLVNNRVMVPLRFVSEALNKTVTWDDTNKTVLIY